ncbi:von Willebrand factor A domain-containing protein 2-like [Acropora muricata]|uniref:von Willebrand factor A domain-containing protein 2-like n=1 Tax=Acropora muricata TaxID=159855 RepID=UPI0034E612C1
MQSNSRNIWMFAFVAVFFITYTIDAVTPPLPHTKCKRSYKKLGCFEADLKLFDELLITDRDKRSSKNDGHSLNWKQWEASIHSLACRCAKAARKRGFKVFGLQNYGECWSGPVDERTYNQTRRLNDCLMILGHPPPPCAMNDTRECMGGPGVNFNYGLDPYKFECESDPCKNGGSCIELKPSGYKCACAKGFRGESCEKGSCSPSGIYDLGLVIDGSGSESYLEFVQTQIFVINLIDLFQIGSDGTHVGVIVYSNKAKLVFSLSQFHDPVELQLQLLRLQLQKGSRRIDLALKKAETELFSDKEGDRKKVPDVLVVITTGNTIKNSEPYEDVLKPLKDRSIHIMAIGVGDKVSTDELTQIAMGRKENIIQVDSTDELEPSRIHEMISKMC